MLKTLDRFLKTWGYRFLKVLHICNNTFVLILLTSLLSKLRIDKTDFFFLSFHLFRTFPHTLTMQFCPSVPFPLNIDLSEQHRLRSPHIGRHYFWKPFAPSIEISYGKGYLPWDRAAHGVDRERQSVFASWLWRGSSSGWRWPTAATICWLLQSAVQQRALPACPGQSWALPCCHRASGGWQLTRGAARSLLLAGLLLEYNLMFVCLAV